jgi:hypothetical protein
MEGLGLDSNCAQSKREREHVNEYLARVFQGTNHIMKTMSIGKWDDECIHWKSSDVPHGFDSTAVHHTGTLAQLTNSFFQSIVDSNPRRYHTTSEI